LSLIGLKEENEMGIIGIILGIIGAAVGMVVGVVGGLVGIVAGLLAGLLGGAVGLLPFALPVALITIGIILLVKKSNPGNAAGAGARSIAPAPPQTPYNRR
jgi:hypothetical protein